MKLAFKDLYKPESTREEGTLKYFREKLKRKNVSADVKHYEGCEQVYYIFLLLLSLLHSFWMTLIRPHCQNKGDN